MHAPLFGFFFVPLEVFAVLAVFAAVGGGIVWYVLDRARKARTGAGGPTDPPSAG